MNTIDFRQYSLICPYKNALICVLEEPRFCPRSIISFLTFKDKVILSIVSRRINKKITAQCNTELMVYRKNWSAFFTIKLENNKKLLTMQKIYSQYDDFYDKIFEKLKPLSESKFLRLRQQFEKAQRWPGIKPDPFDSKAVYEHLKRPESGKLSAKDIRAIVSSMKDGFYTPSLFTRRFLICKLAQKRQFNKIEKALVVFEDKNQHTVLDKTFFFWLKEKHPKIARELAAARNKL